MAARYPIRLAPLPLSATHRSQNANANSLAGGSACSYGLLVLKGQNVPNIVCAGSHETNTTDRSSSDVGKCFRMNSALHVGA